MYCQQKSASTTVNLLDCVLKKKSETLLWLFRDLRAAQKQNDQCWVVVMLPFKRKVRAPAPQKRIFSGTAEHLDCRCNALDNSGNGQGQSLSSTLVSVTSVRASKPHCGVRVPSKAQMFTEVYRRSCRNTLACYSVIRKEVMRLEKLILIYSSYVT